WRAAEPMATYLAMATVGEYDLDSYTRGGIRYVDAVDPDLDAATRAVVDASFARQPEIVRFLESYAGAYPFRSSGGIVDDTEAFGYALETQARPIYDYRFFTDAQSGDSVVVHELAHQWYGDSLAVQQWDDIWLNEGFATYMEWLWAEREGIQTTQERFDTSYTSLPASFWTVRPGNPGPTNIFDYAVYERGAMTLHQLRRAVGDRVFFRILHGWAQSREGDNVSTAEFIAYAERRSGRELSPLFDAWLYTPSRPALPAAAAATASTRAAAPALRR
ncbi:M1 family aminopeptidase, partial [Spirilliplanes yamanashiensis]